MRKSRMAPVYIGEVGDIVVPELKLYRPLDTDTSKFTYRELCSFAVENGVDVKDIIGSQGCDKHYNMIFLGGKELPEGFNLFEDCLWCRSCYQLFRYKEKQVYDVNSASNVNTVGGSR